MTKYDTATPYLAVHLIFRQDSKVAFVLREHTGWMDGHYGLPGGKVEKDERITQAAIREAKEEVGIDIKPENMRAALTRYRRSEDSDWIDIVFEIDEWQGELVNNEPHIHSELAWLDPENLPENMVNAKSTVFDVIKTGKIFDELGWD
jgi:8-oxo-dGTP diphosphatase